MSGSTFAPASEIPARVIGTATSLTSDTNGTVLPVAVWSDPSTESSYNMIVDRNKNGYYNEGIDALDNNEVVSAR